MNRSETDNEFSTLNPAFSSDVSLSLSQPLLRGAGAYTNTQRIRVAFYAYQRAQARTKLEVIRVLANADKVYWRLYAARQELIVRKQEYDLATAQLDRARHQVKVGIAPEVEITRAESGAAGRLEAIILADNAVRDAERDLKRILNDPDLPMESPTIIATATTPQPLAYKLDSARLAELAMQHRMELLELELEIAAETSNIAFARNDMLPLVSLQYTYNINGLGPSFDDSFAMVADKDFENHTLGLRMQVPIGNAAARSRLRAAVAERLQTLATRAQREAQIRQEVFNAVDQLDANWQRILAARQRVILAARLVDLETRQFEQGLRTSTDVIDAQTNLANARSSEIRGLTEYQIAQIDIAFATGTSLGASRIVWDPTPITPGDVRAK
jgi:outer membrane protein TolC